MSLSDDMSLNDDIQMKVLEFLSFEDLFKVLSLDTSRNLWKIHGLRVLWISHMDRYTGPHSIVQNNSRGQNVSWDWVEENRFKLRELDLYIFVRYQGEVEIGDVRVGEYINSTARCTVTLPPNDGMPYFSRQWDLWEHRSMPLSYEEHCELILGSNEWVFSRHVWEINCNNRRRSNMLRRGPRINPPGLILSNLRPKHAIFFLATIYECMDDLYWNNW